MSPALCIAVASLARICLSNSFPAAFKHKQKTVGREKDYLFFCWQALGAQLSSGEGNLLNRGTHYTCWGKGVDRSIDRLHHFDLDPIWALCLLAPHLCLLQFFIDQECKHAKRLNSNPARPGRVGKRTSTIFSITVASILPVDFKALNWWVTTLHYQWPRVSVDVIPQLPPTSRLTLVYGPSVCLPCRLVLANYRLDSARPLAGRISIVVVVVTPVNVEVVTLTVLFITSNLVVHKALAYIIM